MIKPILRFIFNIGFYFGILLIIAYFCNPTPGEHYGGFWSFFYGGWHGVLVLANWLSGFYDESRLVVASSHGWGYTLGWWGGCLSFCVYSTVYTFLQFMGMLLLIGVGWMKNQEEQKAPEQEVINTNDVSEKTPIEKLLSELADAKNAGDKFAAAQARSKLLAMPEITEELRTALKEEEKAIKAKTEEEMAKKEAEEEKELEKIRAQAEEELKKLLR